MRADLSKYLKRSTIYTKPKSRSSWRRRTGERRRRSSEKWSQSETRNPCDKLSWLETFWCFFCWPILDLPALTWQKRRSAYICISLEDGPRGGRDEGGRDVVNSQQSTHHQARTTKSPLRHRRCLHVNNMLSCVANTSALSFLGYPHFCTTSTS